MIITGADNRPPMLEKAIYDSWKSRMELYIENRENGRMILNSVLNGPLIWPTIEENGTTRTNTKKNLFSYQKMLHADWHSVNINTFFRGHLRMRMLLINHHNNIVLQGLPSDVYAIVNHHKVAKDIWDRVKLLMQGTKLSLQEKECKLYDEFDKFSFVKGETLYHLAILVFSLRDDTMAYLNKTAELPCNKFKGGKDKAMLSSEGHMARQCTQPKRPRNTAWFKGKAMLAEA
ncbi:hypothetical protein Tco_0509452 [Tanacetum coccineum]